MTILILVYYIYKLNWNPVTFARIRWKKQLLNKFDEQSALRE